MNLRDYTYNGEKVINVPNTITGVRGLLMLASSLAVLMGGANIGYAIAYAIGAACDGLDGIAARTLDQKTEFGKKFDPKVDAISFITGLSALAIVSPTVHERVILTATLTLQLLYSSHLAYQWEKIPVEKQKEFGPSMVGKTKTAITMVSLVKLMGGKSFLEDLGGSTILQDINTLLVHYGVPPIEYSITQLDAALHTGSLGGIGVGALGTLWCWYSYNKKAKLILGDI